MSNQIVDINYLAQGTSRLKDVFHTEYDITTSFYSMLSFVSSNMSEEKKFSLPTGVIVDPTTTGGMLATSLYIQLLQARQDMVLGITGTVKNLEKKCWNMS